MGHSYCSLHVVPVAGLAHIVLIELEPILVPVLILDHIESAVG